ncbi:transcription factor RelB-like isoform X1 [Mobula hypostoma]|uniref:transcription factor RelB-like isoform X1 n=2 Tax=Mobula hypostoma TaxID=723540 RepID=UPI002FC34B06
MKSREQEQLPGPPCPSGPGPYLQADQNFDLNILNEYILKDLEEGREFPTSLPCDYSNAQIGEIRNQLMDTVPGWGCSSANLLAMGMDGPQLVARGTGSPRLAPRAARTAQLGSRGAGNPASAARSGAGSSEAKHRAAGRATRSSASSRPAPRCLPLQGPGGLPDGEEPKLVVIEQPKQRGMRFRYECEGRSAGSIPGESTTELNKTLPTVQIQNWQGEVKVIISLVTKDEPYKPHPHSLVGKDCQNGICEVTVSPKCNMKASFANLGIQCVKKKEVTKAIEHRLKLGIDPFNAGDSLNYLEDIDMNVVRLCFQAFIQEPYFALTPVLSEPIYDKKATNTSELRICRLNKDSGVCSGGEELFLLCDKVQKEDIAVIFSANNWEARGVFSQTDVHRQIAIVFKTPPYCDIDIQQPVSVSLRLFRPSDREYSDPFEFRYIPKEIDYYGIQSKWKRKVKFPPISTFIGANAALADATTGPKNSVKYRAEEDEKLADLNHINKSWDYPNQGFPAFCSDLMTMELPNEMYGVGCKKEEPLDWTSSHFQSQMAGLAHHAEDEVYHPPFSNSRVQADLDVGYFNNYRFEEFANDDALPSVLASSITMPSDQAGTKG